MKKLIERYPLWVEYRFASCDISKEYLNARRKERDECQLYNLCMYSHVPSFSPELMRDYPETALLKFPYFVSQ